MDLHNIYKERNRQKGTLWICTTYISKGTDKKGPNGFKTQFFAYCESIRQCNSKYVKMIVLYTSTCLYRNTSLVASISEPVFPLFSIRYSFRYIFSPKYTMHEVYIFCGEQGRKLKRQLLFCFELDVSALLRRHEIVTARENSRDFLLGRRGGMHSHLHLFNKTMFLL